MVVFVIKTTLTLVIVGIATALMRRSSAASRHVVWTCGLLAVLLLPVASWLVPALPLPLLRPTIADAVPFAGTQLPERQMFEAVPWPLHRDLSPSAHGTGTSTTAVPTRPARPWPWPWLSIVWVIGAVIVLSRSAFGLWLRAQLQRRCSPTNDERVAQMTVATARAMAIRRRVAILIAPTEMMPATWGLWRPKLLLPPSATSWTDERLRVVLVHEIAHVMRVDVVSATIARAATAFAWWHPLVWFAASRAQLERERACDDTVLRAGVAASSYADELLTIAQTLPSPFTHQLALAMARPNRLGARVSSILDATRRRTGTSHTVAIATSVLMAAQWPLAAVRLVSPEIAPVIERSNFSQLNDLAVFSAYANAAAPPQPNSAHSAPDLIASHSPTAATNPDFSGHWRFDGSTSPLEYRVAQSVAPFGAEFIATQDGDGLAVEYVPVATYSTGRGSLAQVRPVERTSAERFAFNGWATNQAGGGVSYQAFPSGTTTGGYSYTVRDNARWDNGVLDITTTETSQQQDYTTKIRRLRRDGDAIVIDTTTWSNYQPQVATSRYLRAPLPAVLNPATQSGPQPIPYGQFGAGAYRPGNGVANPYRKREVKPEYTDEARKAGLKGTVELEAIVGVEGTVTDVRVVRSLDDKLGLDENAKDIVRRTSFVPCKIGETPVACLVVFELQYALSDGLTPQRRPALAGRWAYLAGSQSPLTKLEHGGLGPDVEIVLTGTELTLIRRNEISTITTSYRLDGSESRNVEAVPTISRASWEGTQLRVATWIADHGRPTGPALNQVLSLDQNGALVVETTNSGPTERSRYARK